MIKLKTIKIESLDDQSHNSTNRNNMTILLVGKYTVGRAVIFSFVHNTSQLLIVHFLQKYLCLEKSYRSKLFTNTNNLLCMLEIHILS